MALLQVGIREFRHRLSHYLGIARSGRIVEITDHGEVIAQLVPAQAGIAGRLEALQAAGMIRWSGKKLETMEPVAKIKGKRTVASLVSEMRD